MKKTTKQKLIDATFEEVFSHGYQGAALSNILTKAEVHKGSMYYYFASKKEMTIAAIKEKMSMRFNALYESIIKADVPYLPKLFDIMLDIKRRDFERGCPLGNLVQEMSNLDKDFNLILKEIYADFRATLKHIFDAAIEIGEMKECDTSKLALFSVSSLEGAILSAKASGNEQDYTDAIEILIAYLSQWKKNQG